MKKRIFGLILSLSLVLGFASGAQAVSFNLTGSNPDALTFNFSQGGINLTVTGTDGFFGIPFPKKVTQDSLGLGVKGFNGSHSQVDGVGSDEFLKFTFDQQVILNSVTFARVGRNDDYRIYLDDGLFAQGDIPGTGNFQVANYGGFSLLSRTGTVIDFTAISSNDDYSIRAIDVSAANPPGVETPEPGTVLLFGTGMLGLGFWRWRNVAKVTQN